MMIADVANNTERELLEKLSTIFGIELTGKEYLLDLVEIKWYEIEMFRAIDFFLDDLEHLANTTQIAMSSEEVTVRYYVKILSDCELKGLHDEVLFLQETVAQIQCRLSVWRRAFPLIFVVLSMVPVGWCLYFDLQSLTRLLDVF